MLYLSGTPEQIGLAHGHLLRDEIGSANRRFLESFEALPERNRERLQRALQRLEQRTPAAYLAEMRAIARGAGLSYEQVLFLNNLTTLSEGERCFAFSAWDREGRLMTFRQIDSNSDMYEQMVLFIVRPDRGHAFAALLNPGWVDGETGMNARGLTLSQNNIGIRQTAWNVTPVTILTRHILQHASTIDEAFAILRGQDAWPARLLFVSQPEGAAVFEMANGHLQRLQMSEEGLALANHPRRVPADDISANSVRRLEHADRYLAEHRARISIDQGIALLRSPTISSFVRNGFTNKQSVVFRPATLDFWIALRPDGRFRAAASGAYEGFNLAAELGAGTGRPVPQRIPAR
ncbi:MAG: hypothetical protein JSW68_12910 [Burkholderiales bacterium]|nr:MAG: hypothetical protein JSW68_12910 [Burkholderiales bacterium]